MGSAVLMLSVLLTKVLQEYVCLVEDVETKLNLAMKYKCHDVVVDVSLCFACWGGEWLFLLHFEMPGASSEHMTQGYRFCTESHF